MSEETASLVVSVDTRQVATGVNDLERLANASLGVERNIQRAAGGFSSYSNTIRQLSPLLSSTVYALNSSNSAFRLMGDHSSAASARMIAGMSGAASAAQIANRAIHEATGSMTAGMSGAASASQRAASLASDAFAGMATRNRASMGAMTESMMHSLENINVTLTQLNASMANTSRTASNTANALHGVTDEIGNTGAASAASINNAQAGIRGLSASAIGLRGLFAGLFSGFAVTESIKGLVGVNAEMQTLRTRLATVTGDINSAAVAFKNIQTFAAQTPFEISQVTDAFIQLKNAGLDASNNALTSYGNTASAMGKQLSQVIAAVADATHGQYERLIDAFGIQTHKMGDQVEFTFKGVSTTVGNNAQEITAYLQKIGDIDFAGGMERQAKTIDGVLSTLKDNFRQYIDELIPEGGESAIAGLFQGLADNITGIANTFVIATSSLTSFAIAEGVTALATGGLTSALVGLETAMVFIAGLNPFSLVLATVGAASAALYLYRDALVSVGETNASISDYLESTWILVRDSAIDSVNTILKLFPAIGVSAEGVGSFIADVFKSAWSIVANLAKAAANFVIGAFNGVGQAMGIVAAGIVNNFNQAFSKVKAMAAGLASGVKSAMSGDFSFKDLGAANAKKANFSDVAGDVKTALGKAFSTDYVGNFAAQIKVGATQLHSLRTMIDSNAASMSAANKHTEALTNSTNKLGGAHKSAGGHAGKHGEAQQSLNKMLDEAKRLTESLFTPEERFNSEMNKATQLYNKGAISLETYNRALSKTRDELNKTSEVLQRQQAMWDEYVKQANDLDKIKDDAAGAQRIANRAEELKLQGLSIDAIKEQLDIEKQINDAIIQTPNIDTSQVEEYTRIRIEAESKVNKIISKNVAEQDTAYKRMLENIQDAGAKMFEDLFNGDGVKSFSSFLDTIKSAFVKVISNDFSRALGTLFSNAKTDWSGIFTGVLAVGVSAIANILTSDKKTTSPSIATTTTNTNIYGTGAMAIADTSSRTSYLGVMSETVRHYNEQLNLLYTVIKNDGVKIWELASGWVTKFFTNLLGDKAINVVSTFIDKITGAYNSLSSFGSELVGGVGKIVSNAMNVLTVSNVGIASIAGGASLLGAIPAQSGAVASAISPTLASGTVSAVAPEVTNTLASQISTAITPQLQSTVSAAASSNYNASFAQASQASETSGGSSIPYAQTVIALVTLGYNLFQIAANNYTTTLEKVSQSFYAAESAAVAALGVMNPVAWVVGSILRVIGSVTQMASGDFAGGISNLLGGHIGGLISDLFKNDPSASLISYIKPNPNSSSDETSSYFTSSGTQSASVGVKTPFGYVDARLNDVGNVIGIEDAKNQFLPLLKTMQAFDIALATSMDIVDDMFGQGSTLDQFSQRFKQTEHELPLDSLNSASFVSMRLDDIAKVMGETGTKAGETFSVWWGAFSKKLLKPGNENADYNATTSFNIEAFLAAKLPVLAQLPTKLADLFVASVKSVADGATQAEFEGQMNDFFTGWTIAEQGLKQVGISIENTALPEYLTSLTKIGFTVKDAAIALTNYADTFAYAGSTASDKFNEAFDKIFKNAAAKGYTADQTTGFISSYTTFGGTFKDIGIAVTNDALTTLADKLNTTAIQATQAANDLIDHAIADNNLSDKSRESAIQFLVLQGKLDSTKIAAASFGVALTKAQQTMLEGIDFWAQVMAGTGASFETLGLSANDLANASDVLIERFGDMKTAISETAAFIETAFGKTALTQYQSNQAYSQQQAIIDRNPQFVEYGLFAGMNTDQLQAANVAAANVLGVSLNDLIAQGVELMVSNPDLQTFVNLVKNFDPATNPTGYQYNTDFSKAVGAQSATSTSATDTAEASNAQTLADNAKTLADLQKTITDRLVELSNSDIENTIASINSKISEMIENARAAGGELSNLAELQIAELKNAFKADLTDFNNIGLTDMQKSLNSISDWANNMLKVSADLAKAYSITTDEAVASIEKLRQAKLQDVFKSDVADFNNIGKTDFQKSISSVEEWAGKMVSVAGDIATAYGISTQEAINDINALKNNKAQAVFKDLVTEFNNLGKSDYQKALEGITTWYDEALNSATDIAEAYGVSNQYVIDGITKVRDARLDALNKESSAIGKIKTYIDSLKVGDKSPLTNKQQFAEAQAQFNAQLALAQSGDSTALANITGFADTLLGKGQKLYTSSDTYTQLFNSVTSQLEGLGATDYNTQSLELGKQQVSYLKAISEILQNNLNKFDSLFQSGNYNQAATFAQQQGYSNNDIAGYVQQKYGVSTSSTESWLAQNGFANAVSDPVAQFNQLYQAGNYMDAAKVAKDAGYTNTQIADYVSQQYGVAPSLTEDWLKQNGYANGGSYPGGLALVGEQGPELINFDSPGQVYTAPQTQSILNNRSNEENKKLLEEMKVLREKILEELQALREESKRGTGAIIQSNFESTDVAADKIVSGHGKTVKESDWKKRSKVELV